MKRRYWPAALAIFSLLVLGSYLAYTDYLVRRIRAESRLHTEMYAAVQRGLFSPEQDAARQALSELQSPLKNLGVPIVVLDTDGQPTSAENLPFAADFESTTGRARVVRYAQRLGRSNAPIVVPNVGQMYFGAPASMRGLVWVPWLQMGGAVLLLVLALGVVRSSLREERERLWAAMARELAHQMGTPLSSLSGWMEVLRLPAREREAMASTAHIANVISADVERLERVSRRFELIGKPTALDPVRLEDVVRELERYFRPRLPRLARGVSLKVRLQRNVPVIEANRVLLVWALENVVKNAIDALAGRGGRITIVSHPGPQGRAHLHIMDNGPGIAPSVKDRIFEAGITTKSSGWGVGLSLTQRIIEDLHGGKITAHARKKGGTVFDIVLPPVGARKQKRSGVFK
ncbi:MAG TPA: ATP-binding protein [Longimicrobiales bacterium]